LLATTIAIAIASSMAIAIASAIGSAMALASAMAITVYLRQINAVRDWDNLCDITGGQSDHWNFASNSTFIAVYAFNYYFTERKRSTPLPYSV